MSLIVSNVYKYKGTCPLIEVIHKPTSATARIQHPSVGRAHSCHKILKKLQWLLFLITDLAIVVLLERDGVINQKQVGPGLLQLAAMHPPTRRPICTYQCTDILAESLASG